MPFDALQDINQFLLPLYNSSTTPSKLNTTKKGTGKLKTFETAHGSKWDELMEVQLWKVQSKQSANIESSNPTQDLQSQLHLEGDSNSNSIDIDEEAGV